MTSTRMPPLTRQRFLRQFLRDLKRLSQDLALLDEPDDFHWVVEQLATEQHFSQFEAVQQTISRLGYEVWEAARPPDE